MARRSMKTLVMVLGLSLGLVGVQARAEAPAARIKVLTFNVWGIMSAKSRLVRAQAIGHQIARLDPDVVAIEEAFEKRHRDALLKALEQDGYPLADTRYFRNLYGSGILFLSKFPIESAQFEPYRVNSEFYDLERLAGKGIAHLRLRTPWGPLDFFHTHALARMKPIFDEQGNFIPGDPKQIDRILQMYQIDRFVRGQRHLAGRSIIAAGDFNVSPEMLEYQFLAALTGFESSLEVLHPGENPSTFSRDNPFVADEFSRIDHIFYKNYRGTDGFYLRPVESRVEMAELFTNPRTGEQIHYSDHYGLWTEFEVITAEDVAPSPEGVVPLPCPCQRRPLTGYQDGVLTLGTENLGSWQDLALSVLKEAYEQKNREDRLVLPLAEVVTAKPSPAVRVEFSGEARDNLEKVLCGDRCAAAVGNRRSF